MATKVLKQKSANKNNQPLPVVISPAPSSDAVDVLTEPEPADTISVLPDGLFGVRYDDPHKIMESKRYVKGGAEYMSPAEILEPVIRILGNSGGAVTLSASHETENGNRDGSINRAYGRLNLVTRFEVDNEMFYEIGILVAYDLQMPRVKVYRGVKVAACLNLCVFAADDLVKFDIGSGINQKVVGDYVTQVAEQVQRSCEIVRRLKEIRIERAACEEIIGKMLVRSTEKKLLSGTTSILYAVDLLTDSTNKYFYGQDNFNAWLLFNSLTEYYGKKVNFFDIPEKTRDTFLLLQEICLA